MYSRIICCFETYFETIVNCNFSINIKFLLPFMYGGWINLFSIIINDRSTCFYNKNRLWYISKHGLGDPLIEVMSVDSRLILRYFGNADITLLYFMIYKSSKNHFKNLDLNLYPFIKPWFKKYFHLNYTIQEYYTIKLILKCSCLS